MEVNTSYHILHSVERDIFLSTTKRHIIGVCSAPHTKPPWRTEGTQCLQILHRDIKSGNILLSRNLDLAKICDVGFAHIVGNTSLSSQSTQTTWAYAAPEMIMGSRYDTAGIRAFEHTKISKLYWYIVASLQLTAIVSKYSQLSV